MSDGKQTQTLVPKLRFPEFRGTRAWLAMQLRVAARTITNGDANSEDHVDGGQYPLFDRSILVKASNRNLFNAKAIILPGEGASFPPRLYEGKFALHQRAYALMEFSVHYEYLFYAIDSTKDNLARNAVASTVRSLRLPIIQKHLVPMPSQAEQRKIAECLQSVDELLALETKRLEALKRYKKGLLQQLFPAEGQNLPSVRAPQFRNAGEWKRRRLNEISPSIFDGTHQTPAYVDEGVPFFSVENLISGRANKFITRSDYEVSSRYNRPEKNDVLITRIGSIGKAVYVDWSYDFSIYVTLAVIKSSPTFDSRWLVYALQSEAYQSEIRSVSLEAAVPCKVNMQDLRETAVSLPEIHEQRAIAIVFTELDAVLQSLGKRLEVLSTHKAALMQQLFPTMADLNA